jgi:membrane-associated phospholipid phosphatase
MLPPADNPAPLSGHWAYVVQSHSDTLVEQGHLAGRVEHVISGQATAFQSLETLLAFIAQVFHEERTRSPPLGGEQRWHDLAFALARAEQQSPNRQARLAGILHTALHDAVIVTWAAKYQFNRKPPSQMAPDVTPVALITGVIPAPELSYPSEHAALAGTTVGILTSFFPKEEATLKAMATEVGQTRLQMGANYRSDIDAGFALGQAVAQKALARAATDGADAKWTARCQPGQGSGSGRSR